MTASAIRGNSGSKVRTATARARISSMAFQSDEPPESLMRSSSR
ncbi:hypothetical protein ACFQY7_39565 [Actinomadura luteofluorescens]